MLLGKQGGDYLERGRGQEEVVEKKDELGPSVIGTNMPQWNPLLVCVNFIF